MMMNPMMGPQTANSAGMALPGYGSPALSAYPSTQIMSPLDRWSWREKRKPADQLTPEELPELYDFILRTSEALVRSWKPRDDRMLDSQKFWEVGSRYAEMNKGKGEAKAAVDEEQEGETMELNDGYLTVDKITSMGAGANWEMEVPPGKTGLEDVAQDIENMLRWAEDQLDRKYSLSLHGKLIRDEMHFAALRGWITGMIVPNPKDAMLPWTYLLEDPLFVYPRYAGEDLIQVVHKYSTSVLEAQSLYEGAQSYLMEKDDDDQVEVLSYYDPIYKICLLVDAGYDPAIPYHTDSVVLQPLTRHGYVDFTGKPINPWIIVTPRGAPTRRFSSMSGSKSHQEAVAYIGLDVLYPIKNIIIQYEKLLAMMLTEVAKGVNPPRVIFFDGFNKPEELDLGVGATNYMVMHSQDAKILESTAMKPDAEPILGVIQDRIQRGSIPSVLYGQAGFAMAGYAINLLTQGAQDVMQPLLSGVQRYRELRFQRMLEMYVNIGWQFAGPLQFGATDPISGRKYASAKFISPEMILANGVRVDVSYDTVTPRDAVPLMQAAIGANQAGILPLYDAMKDYAGIKDPKAAMRRLAEGMNYQDPLVQKHLARKAGMESGNEDLRTAVVAAMWEEQMMMMMQQQMAAQGGEGSAPGAPNAAGGQVGPGLEASPPANQDPVTSAANQAANVSAALNVGNGGTPPDLMGFLGAQ